MTIVSSIWTVHHNGIDYKRKRLAHEPGVVEWYYASGVMIADTNKQAELEKIYADTFYPIYSVT